MAWKLHSSSGMVTATAIAMVPGGEACGACSALSGGADIAGMPFAVSMEAEMAVSAPSQPSQAGQTGQGTATENVPAVKTNGAPKLESALKGKFAAAMTLEKVSSAEGEVVQSGAGFKASTGNTKILIPAASTKVSAIHPEEKETAEAADVVPTVGQKQTFGATGSIETPTAATSVADDVAQQTPARLKDVNAAMPNEAETIKPMPNVPEDVEKTAGLELKDELIGMVVETTSHKATAKGDGEAAKKGKVEKDNKTEKDTAEKEENATALAAVSVPVVAQLVMTRANPAEIKLDKGQESVDLSLPTSVKITAGAKGKRVSAANDKDSKKTDEVKRPDEKTGLKMVSKFQTEGELKKPDSGGGKDSIGEASADVESSKIHTDGAAAHVEGAASGSMGIVPAVHPGHADAVVSRSEPASPQSALMQHGTAMLNEVRSEALRPGEAAPRTIVATPTMLEVGIANGTHGWLKVRAEMTGAGTVNASLATASASGQEMLHRELPSLTAYLHSEHVAVNTVVVQQASVAADLRGHAGGMMGDGRGQAGQNSGQPGGENRQHAARYREPVYRVWSEGREELLPLTSYADGGGWLSVRA